MSRKFILADSKDSQSNSTSKETTTIEASDNRIYFYGDVENDKILKLNQELIKVSNDLQNSQRALKLSEPTPIYLYINSRGGTAFAAFDAMDEIINCQSPVYTVVSGCAASAATILSLVGKKRFIKKHSYMLIHQMSSGMWGTYEQLKDEIINCAEIMKAIKGVYEQYTRIPAEELDEILKHDIYWNAETCLKYNLVDKII